MTEAKTAKPSVFEAAEPKAYTARELARRSVKFGGNGLPITSECEIRAWTRRRKNPLPCMKSGAKRPIVRIFEPVFLMFLLFEMGVAEYDEVDEAARQCVMGAWS